MYNCKILVHLNHVFFFPPYRRRISNWRNCFYFWQRYIFKLKGCPLSCTLDSFVYFTHVWYRSLDQKVAFNSFLLFHESPADWVLPSVWCCIGISYCARAPWTLCKDTRWNKWCMCIYHSYSNHFIPLSVYQMGSSLIWFVRIDY